MVACSYRHVSHFLANPLKLIDKASKKPAFKSKTAHLTTFKHFFAKKKTLDLQKKSLKKESRDNGKTVKDKLIR